MTRLATNSTLPSQAAFHHAVLRYLVRHPDGDNRQNIHEAIPDLLGLTESQRTERLRNLPHLRYRHRSGWALSMLKAAGYVDNPEPALWRITDRGRELLSQYPDGFDEETGRRVIREGRSEIQGQDLPTGSMTGADSVPLQTPDERIDAAMEEIRRTVARELIERIAQASAAFFEMLVLDVLHALGYGASAEDIERVGRSGDGGIDGVISLDKLGFEKIYVQAKRWQSPVGPRLSLLMIECGVGVSHYRTFRLPKVDDEYFDSD